MKSKIKILWSMRKWPIRYVMWRLTTAYPEGWKYALKHPIRMIADVNRYLIWCQKMDSINDEEKSSA